MVFVSGLEIQSTGKLWWTPTFISLVQRVSSDTEKSPGPRTKWEINISWFYTQVSCCNNLGKTLRTCCCSSKSISERKYTNNFTEIIQFVNNLRYSRICLMEAIIYFIASTWEVLKNRVMYWYKALYIKIYKGRRIYIQTRIWNGEGEKYSQTD